MKPNRALAFGGYAIAAYLVLAPLTETFLQLWPFRIGDARWRYGAAGVMSQSLMTPLLGLLLAVGIAVYLGHRTRARLLAALSTLGSLVTLIVIPLFVLDAVEMRALLPRDQGAPTGSFDVATAAALLKMVAAVIIGLALARGAWVGTRGVVAAGRAQSEKQQVPIVSARR
jgi:hypothetical protein